MNIKRRSGFTLLEVIIVIIIIGVLASLALPRLFSTIEFARANEAMSAFQALRGSLERCYLARGGNYTGCQVNSNLDVQDPAGSINAHFTYTISGQSVTDYTITARRNTRDGGNTADIVQLSQTSSAITRTGTGAFAGIQ